MVSILLFRFSSDDLGCVFFLLPDNETILASLVVGSWHNGKVLSVRAVRSGAVIQNMDYSGPTYGTGRIYSLHI